MRSTIRRAREARLSALFMLGCAAVLLAPVMPFWALGYGGLALVLAFVALMTIVGAIGGFYEARLIEQSASRHPSAAERSGS